MGLLMLDRNEYVGHRLDINSSGAVSNGRRSE
jgi:hypothetical protein